MTLIIKTKKDKDRVKIYRWLQRHNAFAWMIDGKNYSKLSNTTVKSKEHLDSQENVQGGLDFAECDGNKFYIDQHTLKKYPEITEEVYNYLKSNIGNGIYIYNQLVVDEEDLKYIFDKREISPDCEQCNIFQLFQLKEKEREERDKKLAQITDENKNCYSCGKILTKGNISATRFDGHSLCRKCGKFP